MNHVQACLGGWCTHRNACANYHAEDREHPVERLCERGKDQPLPVVRLAATTRPAPAPEKEAA